MSNELEDRSQKTDISFYLLFSSVLLLVFSFFCLLPSAHADDVSSRAALVMDGRSGKILYAKNPHLRVPPASTTKLVTAMVVLDRLSLDTVVTISERAAETPTVAPHLYKGERYTVRDLLYLALMRSVNSATVALAEATTGSEERFVNLMNQKVSMMGLENTRFINSSGLPEGDQYITAFDLAIIMKESLQYPTIREIINTKEKEIYSLDGRKIHVRNTNNLLWKYDSILGGKTGYTRAAGHCLVCVEDRDNNLLITVALGESSRDNLWESTSALLLKGTDVLNGKIAPSIYLSSVKNKTAVFASYKTTKKVLVKAKTNKKVKKIKKSSNIAKKTTKKPSKTIVKKIKKSSNIAKKTTKKPSKTIAKKNKKIKNLTVNKKISKKEVKS